ncbi:MAG: antitoxin [Solobacterium sp.]|nr:antitoxin [Solobacterium sp.]
MHSGIAKELDHPAFLAGNIQPKDVCERVDEQYGRSAYGSVKYSPDEMYWIGYIYRYFAYTYEYSSARVYRIVKPKELRGLFMPYHTIDPAQAVDRILEAKGLAGYDPADIQRQYRIFRTIRLGN